MVIPVPICTKDEIWTIFTATDTNKFDNTESFWFAEVLKYLYLTFDDPSHISLDECMYSDLLIIILY
jgi:hypothetical protein